MKSFILFYLPFSFAIDTDSFHTIFNFVYNDVCLLTNIFKIHLPDFINCELVRNDEIIPLEYLEYAAFTHIEAIYDFDCVFSHNSCSHLCNIYHGCSFEKRIEYFLPDDIEIQSIGEVLLSSKNQNPINIIADFLKSKPHADILYFYGFAKYNHLYNINFLKTNLKIIDEEKNNLKDTIINFENKKYFFTIKGNCLYTNLIYNFKDKFFIYEG